ncbi:MAG TPA: homocysteine S-methyltransferase family protein [Candidatus Atribacteria bacterium]|nr:homocysteine S-methyltransferase family protein [Candidatus Atribacteria bacterium]
MVMSIMELIKQRIVLFDGGMGTELIKKGLNKGESPELWNEKYPEKIKEVHQAYFEAGADAVMTNSFGGSPIKLKHFNLEKKAYELNKKAAEIARKVKPSGKYVGGSIGPAGQFLKPHGPYEENEFYEAYHLQAKALIDGGVDFILIETQYDLREAKIALEAALAINKVPVFVTMTFNETKKGYFTIMGNSLEQCQYELVKIGAQAIGANCTLDSRQMVGLVRQLKKDEKIPVIIQANAGQPLPQPDGSVKYSQDLDDYVKYIPEIIKEGARIIGGCCGTNPEYIKKIKEIVRNIN